MLQSSRFIVAGRCGVVILAVIAVAQFAIEFVHAPRVLQTGVLAKQLFDGTRMFERGPTTFVVVFIPPESPLQAEGVVPGDRVRWDSPLGR